MVGGAVVLGHRKVVRQRVELVAPHSGRPMKSVRPGGFGSVSLRQKQSDADGIKLEILHRPRERDMARRLQELERRIAELEGG